MSRTPTLGDGCRGELFTGLGRALMSGLDPVRALDAVADVCGGRLGEAIVRSERAVARGSALSRSLGDSGLLSPLDRALVVTGETTGHVDRILALLGERYLASHARWRQIRGRLLMPALLLAVALITAPLPALVAGRISGGEVLVQILALTGLIAACTLLVRGLWTSWREGGTPPGVSRLARAVPGLGRLVRQRARAQMCEALALCLQCGQPAVQALTALRSTWRHGPRRDALDRGTRALKGGASVAEALSFAGMLGADGHALVDAAEQAGRLPDALARHAETLNGRLDDVYDSLARALPGLIYAIVVAFVAAGILGVF